MTPSLDRRSFLGLATGAALVGASPAPAVAPGAVKKGLVTGQPEGAAAGMAILAAGGNAVDAAVAAALVAAVVSVQNCGIAGYGGHMVIARPKGKPIAIDFNSTAPAAARANMYEVDERGAVKGQANTFGWLAAGVPGTLAGLQLALDRHGTRPFARLVEPAIRYARDGFPVSARLARVITGAQARLRRDAGSAKLFFRAGKPLAEGATFRNRDLADLLQKLAERGSVESFYRGDVGRQIAEGFRKNGGLVTAKDMAAYRAQEAAPLALEWNGQTIYTAPLTAGGLTVLQALATLKALDWGRWPRKGLAVTQARVEALRIAWMDRLRYLGDPKQAMVPVDRLLSERYARASADRVRTALARKKPVEGKAEDRAAGGTIHLTAVDGAGMMVALTLTHGGAFGAQVTVDGLGLVLGHGMSRFEPRPGHPNSPGPGKRPLHNMCPTIVYREGRPMLALGATGGRRIPNTLYDVLAYRVGEGRGLAEAVKAPRMHTEGTTRVALEKTWPAAEVKYLQEVGYTVVTGVGANLNAIEWSAGTGAPRGAAR